MSICFLPQSSQQDAIKQNEELKKDVNFLRTELQLVRDERDHLLPQVKNLTIEVDNYKEFAGKSSKDLDSISTKTIELEVCFEMWQSHHESCFFYRLALYYL